MSALPTRFVAIIVAFSGLVRQRTWRHAERLLLGAILAPGIRTVASVLRVVGLADERHFVNYHRVLSRAVWSSRAASRVLVGLVVRTFVPRGPIVLGIDDTIERRRGAKIRATGIYRDPVRSSHNHFVKTRGLRWLSVMLLAPIPWAKRVWALPVLTALAPSERYATERGIRHKRLTDWARQLLLQLHRWLPGRTVIMVADASFAALDLLRALAPHLTCITRFRLDAQLYAPAPRRRSHTIGRPRKKGRRLPALSRVLASRATQWTRLRVRGWYGEASRDIEIASATAIWYSHGTMLPIRWVLVRDPLKRFDPQALLCTELTLEPLTILQHFVHRWQVEVTFEAARRHLGLETQRQWSDHAIARTTPVLLSLFSIVTLLAHRLVHAGTLPIRRTAWYQKATPTFSDALAAVRAECWRQESHEGFHISTSRADVSKRSRRLLTRLTTLLCEAA
jgi:DDE superfamily endonuclease